VSAREAEWRPTCSGGLQDLGLGWCSLRVVDSEGTTAVSHAIVNRTKAKGSERKEEVVKALLDGLAQSVAIKGLPVLRDGKRGERRRVADRLL